MYILDWNCFHNNVCSFQSLPFSRSFREIRLEGKWVPNSVYSLQTVCRFFNFPQHFIRTRRRCLQVFFIPRRLESLTVYRWHRAAFLVSYLKILIDWQLTKPKVVSLTRPALLKHFKGTANHAGHIWSQQALVPSISVPSLQDWGWLRGERRVSCTPLTEITKLRVELIKYPRRKGYAQKSDNRERQSQFLFFDYKHSSA